MKHDDDHAKTRQEYSNSWSECASFVCLCMPKCKPPFFLSLVNGFHSHATWKEIYPVYQPSNKENGLSVDYTTNGDLQQDLFIYF
mmetsp:Transcript_7937/g.12248  ORF Transcript_7937/g.12248 Transcript_7937/m.12248 type:complete len:85 (+) Transcript_7937:662-916(+)